MTGESYVIKYESMYQFYNYLSAIISEGQEALEDWSKAYDGLINMESFQGTAANTAKTYLQEVHGALLYAISSALQAYQASFLLYKDGFYDIDGYTYTYIPQEVVLGLRDALKTEDSQLDTISSGIQSALNSIRDIYSLSNPTKYTLQSTIQGVKDALTNYDSEIDSYEESQYNILQGDLDDLLDSLESTIEEFLNSGTNVVSYVPQSYCGCWSIYDLCDKVNVSNTYIAGVEDKINSAIEKHIEVHEEFVAGYEAEMAKQRQEEGVVKIAVGTIATVIGIGAIVCTAGTATPVVVSLVGGTVGTCSAGYGIGYVVEGSYDVYYGSIGDISTEAFNPIRDTVFYGNQELYDLWGSFNLTAAALFLPGGCGATTVKGMTTAFAREATEDAISDFASGKATEFLTRQYQLGGAQSSILNIGLGIGIGLMGGKVGSAFDNFVHPKAMSSFDAPNINPARQWEFVSDDLHVAVDDVTPNASTVVNGGSVVGDGVSSGLAGVDGGLKVGMNFDEVSGYLKGLDFQNMNVVDLNRYLNNVEKIDLGNMDVAKLQTQILQDAGLTNFDIKGNLADITAFKSGTIRVEEIDADLVLYRRGYPTEGTGGYGYGQWWSDSRLSIEDAREQLAILENWGNPLTGEYEMTVTQGTKAITGIAEEQSFYDDITGELLEHRGGGAKQYWFNSIDESWIK